MLFIILCIVYAGSSFMDISAVANDFSHNEWFWIFFAFYLSIFLPDKNCHGISYG